MKVFFIVVSFLILTIFIKKRKKTCSRWRGKTYNELLKRPEWIEKREEVKARDGYRCQYCGSRLNLQVHHKYYSKYPDNTKVNPWNYPDEALITLCEKCHNRVHQSKNIKTYYRSYKD